MPRHLAVEANVIRGTAHFDNSKVAYVYFLNSKGEQVSFSKQPFVSLTILDNTSSPVVKIGWIKNGNLFTGCVIRFNNPYTGDVDWEVKE